MAFHWHGDCFSIPPSAIHLARSAACEQQAFVYDDCVVGLQFHLESNENSVAAMIEHCGEDVRCGQYIQDAYSMESCADYLPAAKRLLFSLLDNLSARSEMRSFPPSSSRTPTATRRNPTVRQT